MIFSDCAGVDDVIVFKYNINKWHTRILILDAQYKWNNSKYVNINTQT